MIQVGKWVLIVIALAALGILIWQVIGGPAYLECLVSTVDPADCHLFGR